jgi:hypothetical protein
MTGTIDAATELATVEQLHDCPYQAIGGSRPKEEHVEGCRAGHCDSHVGPPLKEMCDVPQPMPDTIGSPAVERAIFDWTIAACGPINLYVGAVENPPPRWLTA